MRKFLIISLTFIAVVVAALAGFVLYALNEVSTGQMGMTEINLPSGNTFWVRRQSYAHTLEHLYISASDDYCAPYSE